MPDRFEISTGIPGIQLFVDNHREWGYLKVGSAVVELSVHDLAGLSTQLTRVIQLLEEE